VVAADPGSCRIRCGWYAELQHADGTVTRYCQLATAPLVEEGEQVLTGQVIGLVGSSGHSSGQHLHLETHSGYPASPENAVAPVEFFGIRGVSIG
jgi:murein DD-endopeptidase MepM/ murein hydrolase activator NlpD